MVSPYQFYSKMYPHGLRFKPIFIPCFLTKASWLSFLNCMMLLMSSSLKVVSMAFVFCASFSLLAIFCLILFILTQCSDLVPAICVVGSAGGSLTTGAAPAAGLGGRGAGGGVTVLGAAGMGGGGGGVAGMEAAAAAGPM